MTIDLRSDTVTRPGKEMLAAMFSAEVGDDVFAEDPSVIALEEKSAKLFGMEKALFCPSGTMTNQIAIKVHTQPGDEVICDAASHIYNYEGAGISLNSSAQARLINGTRGKITADQITSCINADYDWLAKTSLVSLENTINKAGGSIYTLEEVKPITKLCKEKKLKLHLDGARLFNALVESGESEKSWGTQFDSISICLSKGLGAPVGSLLLGSAEFIKKARRIRKVFGGGMRQAGYLAAAGIYALDHNVKRLKEDHTRASALKECLEQCAYVERVLPVETNIVIFELKGINAADFERKLFGKGIRSSVFGPQTIRFVTHLDFNDDMLQQVIVILKSL